MIALKSLFEEWTFFKSNKKYFKKNSHLLETSISLNIF